MVDYYKKYLKYKAKYLELQNQLGGVSTNNRDIDSQTNKSYQCEKKDKQGTCVNWVLKEKPVTKVITSTIN